MRSPLKVVHPDDAPDTLIDSWVLSMHAQGLSETTITERTRLIRQLARTTGTDPAALTPNILTTFLASRTSAVTADAYYSIARAWCTWLVRTGHRDDDPHHTSPQTPSTPSQATPYHPRPARHTPRLTPAPAHTHQDPPRRIRRPTHP